MPRGFHRGVRRAHLGQRQYAIDHGPEQPTCEGPDAGKDFLCEQRLALCRKSPQQGARDAGTALHDLDQGNTELRSGERQVHKPAVRCKR